MARKPGCCLYFGFLIHFAAFASLLAGYSTPNWTMVKMSTGETKSLGLVVTCDREKCDMLHVTNARSVFVIIFGLCTFCILLSLFSIQISCLALCNRSCKEKNIGTCLSYLSLFIAFTIGGTLGLYQIDLKEESKPDVLDMWMGWSRFCVIGAAGGFFLGAWLNAADFYFRNRSRNRELMKRTAEVKAKIASLAMSQGQTRDVNANGIRSIENRKLSLAERRLQYASLEKWRTPIEKNRPSPKMYKTVECAVRSARKREPHHSKDTTKDRSRNLTIESNKTRGEDSNKVDMGLVYIAKQHGLKQINVKEAPGIKATTGSMDRNPRVNSTSENSGSESRKTIKREEKGEFSDAALKYRLEKLQVTTSLPSTTDEKRKLSAVQEEPRRNDRENPSTQKEKRVLNRQETKTLVGQSLLQTTAMSLDISANDDAKKRNSEEIRPLKKQLSLDNRSSMSKDSDTTRLSENCISRHTKPHPLQRDGQISSLENSFGSNTKLRQTKRGTESLDDQSSNAISNRISKDDVIPSIKSQPKTDPSIRKGIASTLSTTDSRLSEDKTNLTAKSKTLTESMDGKLRDLQSQDSSNCSELSEEQIKRRQIVESMLQAKKDRKKKRITQ